MSFLGITIMNPVWLLLLLLIPVIIWWYIQSLGKHERAVLKFSSLGMVKKAGRDARLRKHLPFLLMIGALLCLLISFSDPHIPLKQSKEGVSVVLSLDVSGSMKATDYSPNRLEAAKQSAGTLIDNLDPKDNVGIVLFENGASTSSFLTPFKDRAKEKLLGIAARDGATALGDGLALAVDMSVSIPNRKKIVILLSDGVSNSGAISPEEAVTFAQTSKVQVYTIGMGSTEPVVLGYDWFGNPQYAQLDEGTLQTIAQSTSGKYFKSVDGETLDEIYKTISDDIEREKEPTPIRSWFVGLAFILIAILLYLSYSKYRVLR